MLDYIMRPHRRYARAGRIEHHFTSGLCPKIANLNRLFNFAWKSWTWALIQYKFSLISYPQFPMDNRLWQGGVKNKPNSTSCENRVAERSLRTERGATSENNTDPEKRYILLLTYWYEVRPQESSLLPLWPLLWWYYLAQQWSVFRPSREAFELRLQCGASHLVCALLLCYCSFQAVGSRHPLERCRGTSILEGR